MRLHFVSGLSLLFALLLTASANAAICQSGYSLRDYGFGPICRYWAPVTGCSAGTAWSDTYGACVELGFSTQAAVTVDSCSLTYTFGTGQVATSAVPVWDSHFFSNTATGDSYQVRMSSSCTTAQIWILSGPNVGGYTVSSDGAGIPYDNHDTFTGSPFTQYVCQSGSEPVPGDPTQCRQPAILSWGDPVYSCNSGSDILKNDYCYYSLSNVTSVPAPLADPACPAGFRPGLSANGERVDRCYYAEFYPPENGSCFDWDGNGQTDPMVDGQCQAWHSDMDVSFLPCADPTATLYNGVCYSSSSSSAQNQGANPFQTSGTREDGHIYLKLELY